MRNQFFREEKLARKQMRQVFREMLNTPTSLNEGDTVKLDVSRMKQRKFWDTMNPKRKEFIEANEDKVFHVKYDVNHTKHPSVVCLEEDDSAESWLFADQELIKVEVE